MADVKVSKGIERSERQGGEMARRGEYSPLWHSDMFRMSPFSLMRRMSEEMDRMFSGWGRSESEFFAPAIEIKQREGHLVVCADLPGIQKDDIKVEVTSDQLVIQGQRKREEEKQEQGYHRSERSYGEFYRAIPLPQEAEVDKAKAEFKDGVLEISIPTPQMQPKRREIPIG
jgi:HSP20 family protein